MSSKVKIGCFDEERADELVRMWRTSFESGVGIVDPHPLAEQRAYLLSTVIPNNELRVATIDDRIVGFIAATTDSIAQLYVAVQLQRQGIGTTMLDWAKRNSNGSLWLHTFQCNRNAQTFYQQRGFTIVKRGFEEMWQLEDVKYQWTREQNVKGSI